MSRRRHPPADVGLVVPLPRRPSDEGVAPHRHDWHITEIDFVERQALSRLDCDCGATDYRAV